MRNEIKALNTFVAKHPKAQTTGFFDRTGSGCYRVILLASISGRAETASLVGDEPVDLVRAARRAGWRIGNAAAVKKLCDSAPNSRKFRPGNPGYSSYRNALRAAPRT